jgi:hypothetical protein
MSLMQITPEVIKSMAIGHVHKNANVSFNNDKTSKKIYYNDILILFFVF